MGNYYNDVYVRCPFYDKGASHYIQCEGLNNTSAVKLLFFDDKEQTQKEKRDAYSRKYCESNYESCELYKLLIHKYEVIEK